MPIIRMKPSSKVNVIMEKCEHDREQTVEFILMKLSRYDVHGERKNTN